MKYTKLKYSPIESVTRTKELLSGLSSRREDAVFEEFVCSQTYLLIVQAPPQYAHTYMYVHVCVHACTCMCMHVQVCTCVPTTVGILNSDF